MKLGAQQPGTAGWRIPVTMDTESAPPGFYPQTHRIRTPIGVVSVRTDYDQWRMLQFTQPVIVEHEDEHDPDKQDSSQTYHGVVYNIVVADASKIEPADGTMRMSDLTAENKLWWVVSATGTIFYDSASGQRLPSWQSTRERLMGEVAEKLARAAQARHTPWLPFRIGWGRPLNNGKFDWLCGEVTDDDTMCYSGWPLQAVADRYKLERLPHVGMPLSEFRVVPEPYDTERTDEPAADLSAISITGITYTPGSGYLNPSDEVIVEFSDGMQLRVLEDE